MVYHLMGWKFDRSLVSNEYSTYYTYNTLYILGGATYISLKEQQKNRFCD